MSTKIENVFFLLPRMWLLDDFSSLIKTAEILYGKRLPQKLHCNQFYKKLKEAGAVLPKTLLRARKTLCSRYDFSNKAVFLQHSVSLKTHKYLNSANDITKILCLLVGKTHLPQFLFGSQLPKTLQCFSQTKKTAFSGQRFSPNQATELASKYSTSK